ncbi:unnamed protein product [marine sediment metagenome]|uniref:Uncharacterized protein n=1 Tax=marine sediment metagenome TaxID=412755 RepID=X1MWI2_9ZZZZ
MNWKDIIQNWPKTIALIVLTALLFWGHACQPEVRSLIYPSVKVTRPELQIELDSLIATAQYRMADLDQQEAFRDLIFQNALVVFETGTMNPAGIITLLLGLYGATRMVKDTKDRIVKKA